VVNCVPSWSKRAIGYICFIDSFSAANNIKSEFNGTVYGREKVKLQWHEIDNTIHHSSGFYGGNLQGVKDSIPYLKDLGVDYLYLTPIFEAVSNHKYDTINYEKIDPHFGNENDLKELIEACHKYGLRILLDGVFNHTSIEHEWYQKALMGDERYKNYYKINDEGYILFWNGIMTLPVLNHKNPEVQEYFYLSEKSIVRKWLDFGIDGWRLDVAERLDKETIAAIRKNMKTKYPDSLLIGEVVETYGKEWLADGLLDGVMNYVFKGVTSNYFSKKIDSAEYMNELTKMYLEYPADKLLSSWNIISTHDTHRMLYELNNDESLFKLAAILQFAYPGNPVIYYGDELGTKSGEKEVDNRIGMDWKCVKSYENYKRNQPMPWEEINRYNSYHQFYKHLVWLRKNYDVLSVGEFKPVYASNGVIAFMRMLNDKYAFIIINISENQSVNLSIPDEIAEKSPVLKCVYGGNTSFHLNKKNINFYIGSRNGYIFISE
jgi:cyclomaltodextrinase / maltogenic alpha-amylase / neopullulanase